MQVELTSRVITFLKRKIEVCKDEVLRRYAEYLLMDDIALFNEKDDDGAIILAKGSLHNFRIEISVECHYDFDDNIVPRLSKLCTEIYYKTTRLIESYGTDLDISLEPKIYDFCPCGDVVYKDKWCKPCYPYIIEQKDICSICHENEGVWIELECKHAFHIYCWKKTPGLKCPLCRTVQESKYSHHYL